MRSNRSIRRLFGAIKARACENAVRDVLLSRCCTEPLEQRVMLSTVKIPVLNFHRIVADSVTLTNGDDRIHETDFKNELAQLNDSDPNTAGLQNHFNSITLQQYKDWALGNNPTMPAQPWFIAIFDDANDTDLSTAAPDMAASPYGYKGVAAIPTGDVGASTHMSWSDIRTLTSTGTGDYGWEVASHSVHHMYMGDGGSTATGTTDYTNTPSELDTEFTQSYTDINTNVWNDVNNNGTKDTGEASAVPIAFIHPHNDVTTRSLYVGSQTYPLIFAAGYLLSETTYNGGAEANPYIGDSSNFSNGELVRVAMAHDANPDTTISGRPLPQGFRQLLADTASARTFALPDVHPYIPTAYIDHNGDAVVDGTSGADTITATTTTIAVNTGSPTNLTDLKPHYSDVLTNGGHPTLTGFDINAFEGNDTITGASTPDTIDAGSGNDTLNAGGGDDSILGNSGNDTIDSSAGNDTVDGGSGADSIQGGSGNDVLNGSADNDTLLGSDGTDSITGGSGADSITGDNDNDTLRGSDGNDTITGGSGTDCLFGDNNDDNLFMGSASDGADDLNGGSGIDTVDYSSRTNAITAAIGVSGNGESSENDSIHSDIENLTGGGGADSITGSSGDNSLKGNGGNDTITGGAGHDTIDCGSGNDRVRAEDSEVDTIDGGSGTDLFILISGSDFNVDRLSEGDAVDDVISNMEN